MKTTLRCSECGGSLWNEHNRNEVTAQDTIVCGTPGCRAEYTLQLVKPADKKPARV